MWNGILFMFTLIVVIKNFYILIFTHVEYVYLGSFQMTPFFDVTITNLKLATHGGMDSMNAVLISSIAASTFNTQLDSWEPLVEPFDGIFKYYLTYIVLLCIVYLLFGLWQSPSIYIHFLF